MQSVCPTIPRAEKYDLLKLLVLLVVVLGMFFAILLMRIFIMIDIAY